MKQMIYLVRHGHPEFPGGKRICLGRHTDVGLNEEGRRQAGVLAGHLREVVKRARTVYCSPLRRTRETAGILAGDLAQVQALPEIVEMEFGEWDGLDFERIERDYPAVYSRRADDMSIAPPGGESFEDASLRAREGIRRLCREHPDDDRFVLVGHSGINRAFLCGITGTPFRKNRDLPQNYTSCNIIEYDSGADSFRALEIGLEFGE